MHGPLRLWMGFPNKAFASGTFAENMIWWAHFKFMDFCRGAELCREVHPNLVKCGEVCQHCATLHKVVECTVVHWWSVQSMHLITAWIKPGQLAVLCTRVDLSTNKKINWFCLKQNNNIFSRNKYKNWNLNIPVGILIHKKVDEGWCGVLGLIECGHTFHSWFYLGSFLHLQLGTSLLGSHQPQLTTASGGNKWFV